MSGDTDHLLPYAIKKMFLLRRREGRHYGRKLFLQSHHLSLCVHARDDCVNCLTRKIDCCIAPRHYGFSLKINGVLCYSVLMVHDNWAEDFLLNVFTLYLGCWLELAF